MLHDILSRNFHENFRGKGWQWFKFKLSNVTQFMAESRENVTNAVAGDIIGVYDTGTYQVGDTLTVGKNKFEFEPLPTLPLKFS